MYVGKGYAWNMQEVVVVVVVGVVVVAVVVEVEVLANAIRVERWGIIVEIVEATLQDMAMTTGIGIEIVVMVVVVDVGDPDLERKGEENQDPEAEADQETDLVVMRAKTGMTLSRENDHDQKTNDRPHEISVLHQEISVQHRKINVQRQERRDLRPGRDLDPEKDLRQRKRDLHLEKDLYLEKDLRQEKKDRFQRKEMIVQYLERKGPNQVTRTKRHFAQPCRRRSRKCLVFISFSFLEGAILVAFFRGRNLGARSSSKDTQNGLEKGHNLKGF